MFFQALFVGLFANRSTYHYISNLRAVHHTEDSSKPDNKWETIKNINNINNINNIIKPQESPSSQWVAGSDGRFGEPDRDGDQIMLKKIGNSYSQLELLRKLEDENVPNIVKLRMIQATKPSFAPNYFKGLSATDF